MNWRVLRAALGAALVVFAVGAGTVAVERYEAERSLDRQRSATSHEIEAAAVQVTRDLTQEVAIVQGLVALVASDPQLDQSTFAAYTRNYRRGFETLRRVYLVREGRVTHTDRPASGPESLTRLEARLVPSDPMVARAIETGSVVMSGPFKITEGDDVFLYARPIFLGDGAPSRQQFWGFAGINIEEGAITCRLGMCDERPKHRMALRLVIDDVVQPVFAGDAALFDAPARAVRAAARIPGVIIQIAAVPTTGWVEGAPRRWMIRGVGVLLAVFAGGVVLMMFSGAPGMALRTRLWAAVASIAVLIAVLGVAAVIDRFENERAAAATREVVDRSLDAAAERATLELSDVVAVIQNLTTFVEANPNFDDAAFQSYAGKLLQHHSEIRSIQLARDAKISHMAPASRHDYGVIGLDLRRTPAEAAIIDRSIDTGQPIVSGPLRLGSNIEAFLYRRPIYLGGGLPSRARFWGFAEVFIGRSAVECKLGVCDHPQKYRYAMRLVVNDVEQAPFVGNAALFDPKSEAEIVAVQMPGARVELAAIPIDGWSAAGSRRWLIWAIAVPFALAASAGLLLVFFGLPSPVLQVWIGILVTLVGAMLALLQEDVVDALHALGIQNDAVVAPAIVTLIAFALAYTANAALSAFVWPQRPLGHVDSLQRAPAILRSIISVLLYATAALWAAAFAFDLDLRGVGLTSGAVGVVVAFATQRLILDFFSGVMIGIERPFALGDWIEVQSGNKDVCGVVYEMSWRTTSIRSPSYDIVTIPNSVLAQATVANRSRPNRWSEVDITFAVPADVSAERVTATALSAVAPLVGSVLSAEKQPNLHATGIEKGDILYELFVYATLGPNSEFPIRTKVILALQQTFATAGIDFSLTTLKLFQGFPDVASAPARQN